MNSESDTKRLKIVLLVTGLVLCIAVLPSLPALFFIWLRVIVCSATVYIAVAIRTEDHPLKFHFVPLAMLATLFNPLIPIQLPYSLALVINLSTAVYFLTLAKKL